MENLPRTIYMNIDFDALPELRECLIIGYLTGLQRPKDKYILAQINPPLSPFPKNNISDNLTKVVLALVDNRQSIDSIGKDTVMAHIILPSYGNAGFLDEERSVKLGTATLFSFYECAKTSALTYREMNRQMEPLQSINIRLNFGTPPVERKCKILTAYTGKQPSFNKFYLVDINPQLDPSPELGVNEYIGKVFLAFSDRDHDMVAIGKGEACANVLYPGYGTEGQLCEDKSILLGDCTIRFKF